MRSFRTSIVIATAALALSWSGLSRAEDDVSNKKSTTTKSQTQGQGSSSSNAGSTTSGSTGTSSSDLTDTPSPSSSPTTPSTSTDTSSGTSTDNPYGTGYGSTQPYPPYQPYSQPSQDTTPAQTQTQRTTSVSTTTTTAASYDENAGADRAGYVFRPNRPLLATGLGIFAGTYATSVIVAAQSDLQEDKRLYIPVVGPWLDMGERPCQFGDCGQREDWNNALLVGSGVLQGVGLGLTIASLFVPEHRERTRTSAAVKPTVHVLPVSVRAGAGIGAVGTF